MSYLVIARKYRPSEFSSVAGQEHITRTLSNAIVRNKVGHAYLFAGPRGVGKTSTARILSKALNCVKGPTAEPCNECANCKDITSGRSLAVREIDGASHNSVDNVRELIESFRALPPEGLKYKIYIIDEVHMFSGSAFNALLKSLEEPPPNTIFILATTEIHKIPETVISRCQRFDFRALSLESIEKRLQHVVKAEGIACDPEALQLIARLADGSMRDAQSLLDRVQTFSNGKITAAEASAALGSIERGALFEITKAILSRDVPAAIKRLQELLAGGSDPGVLMKEMVAHWREVFFARSVGEQGLNQLGVSADQQVELMRIVGSVSLADIQDLYQLVRDGVDAALRGNFPKYSLEALVVRLATREPVLEMAQVVASIKGGGSLQNTAVPANKAPVSANSTLVSSSDNNAAKVAPSPSKLPTESSGLVWSDFVNWTRDGGARVLSEHLRRLDLVEFNSAGAKATGPEFSVSSILSERVKLEGMLKDFLREKGMLSANPILDIKVASPASLKSQVEKEASAPKGAGDHPAVQSLQKIFPGSKVEKIKSR